MRSFRVSIAGRKGLALGSALVAVALLTTPAPSASAASPFTLTTGHAADLVTTVYPVRAPIPPAFPPHYRSADFKVIVTNDGPNVARNVVVTDGWSWSTFAGFVASPTSVSCTPSGGTLTCTKASLQPGTSISLTVTVHESRWLHNSFFSDSATATSATFDPNTSNNSALGFYVVI